MKISKHEKKHLTQYVQHIAEENYASAFTSLQEVVNEKLSNKIKSVIKKGYFKNERRK